MGAPWTSLPLLAIDFESTSVDPFSARIVEGAAVEVHPDGTVTNPWRRVINPGVDIPEEAAAIHGITTERAQTEGVDPATALAELVDIVWAHIDRHRAGAALTMFNARYDLPLLLTEASRHGVDFPVFAAILDPYLIDRMLVRFVKGKRKLTLVAERYGVVLGDQAHGALADATAAGQVMWQILGRHPEIGSHSLAELWLRQVKGHEKDRVSFESWMRSNVDPDIDIVAGWPVPVRAEVS